MQYAIVQQKERKLKAMHVKEIENVTEMDDLNRMCTLFDEALRK